MGGGDFFDSVWDTDYAKLATLWGVYVREEYRGSRIGLKMEQFGEAALAQHGFDVVGTMVRAGNEMGRANWNHWDSHRGVKQAEIRILADISADPQTEE